MEMPGANPNAMETSNAISHFPQNRLSPNRPRHPFSSSQAPHAGKMDPEMARLQVLSDPEMMARLREVCCSFPTASVR